MDTQNKFTKKVREFAAAEELWKQGERILVGLSGGADSVALLLTLLSLKEEEKLSVYAFHVNHGLRGTASDADEAFCKRLCERLNVPLFVRRAEVGKISEDMGVGLEEAGRKVRYEFAEKIAEEQNCDRIAIAHQENDVAETFLFQLFRGSRTRGLSSIPAKRGKLIRPLLCCSREEIEAFLEEKNETYRVDESNLSEDYSRNKIRNRILTYVTTELNAAAVPHIAQAAEELRDVDEYLRREAEKLAASATETRTESGLSALEMPLLTLADCPRVLLKEVVYCLLTRISQQAKDITATHVAEVCDLCEKQSGRGVDLPYCVRVRKSFDRLIFERKREEIEPENGAKIKPDTVLEYRVWEKNEALRTVDVTIPGEYPLADGRGVLHFCIFPYEKNEQIPKSDCIKWFDYGKIKGTLQIRTKMPGDRMGMEEGSKSVKQILTERKIDVSLRDRLQMLADGERVLWIPGVRTCADYWVEDTTELILEVRWTEEKIHGKHSGTDF